MNEDTHTQSQSIPPNATAILAVPQAAKLCGLHWRTVNSACSIGKIPAQAIQQSNGKIQYVVRLEDVQTFAAAAQKPEPHDRPNEAPKQQVPHGPMKEPNIESLPSKLGQCDSRGGALLGANAQTLSTEGGQGDCGEVSLRDSMTSRSAQGEMNSGAADSSSLPGASSPATTHGHRQESSLDGAVPIVPNQEIPQAKAEASNAPGTNRGSIHPRKGLISHIKNSLRRCNQQELALVAGFILLRMTRHGAGGTSAVADGLDA